MRDRQAPTSHAGTSLPITGQQTQPTVRPVRRTETNEEIPFPGQATLGSNRPRPSGQHCWVTVPATPSRPQAGLLIDWRRDEDGWWGRVVLSSTAADGRPIVTDAWLPADRLRPTKPR